MSITLEKIKKEILSWPDVTAEKHRFGGIEFHLNKKEIGHIHGDRLADLPFPMKARNELVDVHFLIMCCRNQNGLAIGSRKVKRIYQR